MTGSPPRLTGVSRGSNRGGTVISTGAVCPLVGRRVIEKSGSPVPAAYWGLSCGAGVGGSEASAPQDNSGIYLPVSLSATLSTASLTLPLA